MAKISFVAGNGIRMHTELIYVPEEPASLISPLGYVEIKGSRYSPEEIVSIDGVCYRAGDYLNEQLVNLPAKILPTSYQTVKPDKDPQRILADWKIYRDAFINRPDGSGNPADNYRYMLENVQLGVEGYDVYDNMDPSLDETVDQRITRERAQSIRARRTAKFYWAGAFTLHIVTLLVIILVCCL